MKVLINFFSLEGESRGVGMASVIGPNARGESPRVKANLVQWVAWPINVLVRLDKNDPLFFFYLISYSSCKWV